MTPGRHQDQPHLLPLQAAHVTQCGGRVSETQHPVQSQVLWQQDKGTGRKERAGSERGGGGASVGGGCELDLKLQHEAVL